MTKRNEYETKEGKHGTLYLFEVKFSWNDPCRVNETIHQWRYSLEHVYDAWNSGSAYEGDCDAPKIVNAKKVKKK